MNLRVHMRVLSNASSIFDEDDKKKLYFTRNRKQQSRLTFPVFFFFLRLAKSENRYGHKSSDDDVTKSKNCRLGCGNDRCLYYVWDERKSEKHMINNYLSYNNYASNNIANSLYGSVSFKPRAITTSLSTSIYPRMPPHTRT